MTTERNEDIFDAACNLDKELLLKILDEDPKQINLRFSPDDDRIGYDIEGKYCLPIEIAIANSSFYTFSTSKDEEKANEFFDILVEKGAVLTDISTYENNTMLHTAADSGNKYIVRQVINAGVDVNAVDIDGNTALHLAVGNMKIEAIQVLLKHGAEASTIIENKRGILPINSIKDFYLKDEKNKNRIDKINSILKPITEKELSKEFSQDVNNIKRPKP